MGKAGSGPLQMRAMSPIEWGPPDVLQEVMVERPEPRVGEILVRVRAAGVNPTDWKSRSTGGRKLWKTPPILGYDVSGIVESVAEGSVLFHPGDEVFGMPFFPYQAGAYAEYVAGPARHFARKPENIDHVHAASIPLAGLTAWQAINDAAQVQPGQRVLIHGAAGGVGHLAVQIARSIGAYVIGTASTLKHEFVLGLGADEVFDYSTGDFTSSISDMDVVIDPIGGGNAARSLQVLRPGGTLISLIPHLDQQTAVLANRTKIDYRIIVVEPDRAGLKALADLVENNLLHPHVSEVMHLRDAKRAHELGETGRTKGKMVLTN